MMKIPRSALATIVIGIGLFALAPTSHAADMDAAKALARTNNCFKCHALTRDKDGPAWDKVAAKLKGEKRSGMRVHARTGLPCPVCADTVREVSFADRSFQYCPTCQTGGKPLADRRLSRLVR